MNRLMKSGLRNFLILWSGQAVSSLGSSMTSFALIIWAYQQQGTVMSVSLLAFCSYLPSILFSFLAGAITDRWDKKKIMLVSDSVAACGTLTVLLLYQTGSLAIWHLYAVNFILGFMNAFQIPASTVAVSLLAPKEQYTRVSGLQNFSNSLVTILTPALATAVLSFGGLKTVLLLDLTTFAIAFLSLLCLIKIPRVESVDSKVTSSYLSACLDGLRFLKKHAALFRMILFFAFINLLASLAGNSIMPAMVLARTGNNQQVLGYVSSSIGVGSLIGSLLVTVVKPPKNRTRIIFLSCALSFLLCDLLWGLGRGASVWIFAAVAGNIPLPFLGANLTTIMRTKVPLEMQGRVFSTRDTLQYFTIPVGFLLGGLLSDHVFEPFMAEASPLQSFLTKLVGSGKGSGMAFLFLLTGLIGAVSSFLCLKDRRYHILNEEES